MADADIDVFPDTVLRSWDDWNRLEYPSEEDMHHSMPFLSYLPVEDKKKMSDFTYRKGFNRIKYKMVPATHLTFTNYKYTLNRLSTWAEDTPWFEVDRRIRKNPHRSKSAAPPPQQQQQWPRREEKDSRQRIWRKKPSADEQRPLPRLGSKMDVTLAFLWRNTFTTKKMFTFGVRNVALHTCHVYQTLGSPLLIYFPKANVYLNNENRTFSYTTYRSYIPHLIPPHSVIQIKYPAFYVLLTAGKTIFAVDVVDIDIIGEIEGMHNIIIQDHLEPLPPPPPKPSARQALAPTRPSSSECSVMPIPVEWDKTGRMKRKTPPSAAATTAAPSSAKFARPNPPVSFMAPPSSTSFLEPRAGPSWAFQEEAPPALSDSSDEDEIMFIPRVEDAQPMEIICSPELDAILETATLTDLVPEELARLLNIGQETESIFESSSEPKPSTSTELFTPIVEPSSTSTELFTPTIIVEPSSTSTELFTPILEPSSTSTEPELSTSLPATQLPATEPTTSLPATEPTTSLPATEPVYSMPTLQDMLGDLCWDTFL